MSFLCVSVIGCGWLGFPLAQALLRQGYRIKGSTRTLEKIPVLEKAGISSFCLTVNGALVGAGIGDFFNTDVVVITLPFRRDFYDPGEYQKQIRAITRDVQNGKAGCVLFTSSTSVYPDDLEMATEDASFVPDNARSKILREIENELMANPHFQTTVVRLAGLYGSERKIGGFLAGKKDVPGADSPVNLIHLDDAVRIIVEIISQKAWNEIFNACADQHPTKKILYTSAAKKMKLDVPQFSTEKSSVKKIVVNDKVKEILGYRFLHPDPLKDIEASVWD